jgi:hypothetical protein
MISANAMKTAMLKLVKVEEIAPAKPCCKCDKEVEMNIVDKLKVMSILMMAHTINSRIYSQ